ncbi:MAG: HK97 family phage prohead protease, partial [Alphaproteobacteria bacterium]
LSIGYEVLDYYYEDGVRFIKELRLWEVSVVTFPANRSAQILHVKSDSEEALNNSLARAIEVLELE